MYEEKNHIIDIGATIPIGREIQCLLYAGLFGAFCITPSSKCRISANSRFFAVDIESLYIHIPMDGDTH